MEWVPVSGFFLVDKPAGPSSAAVSNKIKWRLKRLGAPKGIKVGHGGTLDPFATGLLPVAVGKATKALAGLLDGPKAYTFTIKWGFETDTLDPLGEVVEEGFSEVARGALEGILPRFTGEISQVPPAFSALKVNGQRAYAMARNGETVELAPRSVVIHSLVIDDVRAGEAVFTACVSKGTYIRCLGRDMAHALGTVGHVTALRRVNHGIFGISEAVPWDVLDKALEMGDWMPHFLPLDAYPAAGEPNVSVTTRERD